jgi:hypothetical protein
MHAIPSGCLTARIMFASSVTINSDFANLQMKKVCGQAKFIEQKYESRAIGFGYIAGTFRNIDQNDLGLHIIVAGLPNLSSSFQHHFQGQFFEGRLVMKFKTDSELLLQHFHLSVIHFTGFGEDVHISAHDSY